MKQITEYIFEKHGIINSADQWKDGAGEIARYVFRQVRRGTGKLYDSWTATKKEFKSLPDWINTVTFSLTQSEDYYASFNPELSSYDEQTGKADINFFINIDAIKDNEEGKHMAMKHLESTMTHECTHAYDYYIDMKTTGGIHFDNNKNAQFKVYNDFTHKISDGKRVGNNVKWMIEVFQLVAYYNFFTEQNAFLNEFNTYVKEMAEKAGRSKKPVVINLYNWSQFDDYDHGRTIFALAGRLKNYKEELLPLFKNKKELARFINVMKSSDYSRKVYHKSLAAENDDEEYFGKLCKYGYELCRKTYKRFLRIVKDYEDVPNLEFGQLEMFK